MDSNALINKLEELKSRQKELKVEIKDLEKQSWDIYEYLTRCAVFDETILFLILDLMQYKEGKKFVPFIYRTISGTFVDANVDIENLFVGITEESNIEVFAKSTNMKELFKDGLGYETYLKKSDVIEHESNDYSFVGRYEVPKQKDRTVITFEFLLDSFGALENGFPVRTCKYDFKDYAYVQDFIKYLFDLQIMHNGNRLSYDDMKLAFTDFVNLMNKKAKDKKLVL